jgi:hypothetical protein
MISVAMPWTTRKWSKLPLGTGKALLWILIDRAHCIDLESIEDVRVTLTALVE